MNRFQIPKIRYSFRTQVRISLFCDNYYSVTVAKLNEELRLVEEKIAAEKKRREQKNESLRE